MQKGLVFLLVLTFTIATAFSQSMASPSLEWTKLSRCTTDTCSPIYLKAHVDPKLYCTEDEFKQVIKKIISKLDLDKTITGFIEIHLLFGLGGDPHVTKVGAKGLSLNQIQIDIIKEGFSHFLGYDCGSHFNVSVNCLGVLRFTIKSGELDDWESFNFSFRTPRTDYK